MPSAITPLANTTLGSAAASVTFSSISGAYRDLVLIITYKASTGANIACQINGDSSSTIPYVYMTGNGSSASSGSSTVAGKIYGNITAYGDTTELAQSTMHFMDYSVTDKHKTVIVRADAAGRATEAVATRWPNTSAITTIAVSPSPTATFSAGTTFALYGVSA